VSTIPLAPSGVCRSTGQQFADVLSTCVDSRSRPWSDRHAGQRPGQG